MQVRTKVALSERQRAVLAAIGRKDHVSQNYVQLVCGEDDWIITFEVIKGLRTLGLVELCFAGTRVRVTQAGRELLGGGADPRPFEQTWTRDKLVLWRTVHVAGSTSEEAERLLDRLVAGHPFSLPEALWREHFCRPADSRAAAASLATGGGR